MTAYNSQYFSTPSQLPYPTKNTSHLWQELATRCILLVIFAIFLGYVDYLLEISELPFKQAIVFYLFWISALATASFGNNLAKTLLWSLLINASMQIYQLAIFSYVENDLVRFGPTLLSSTILFFKSLGYPSSYSSRYLFWIALNLPSIYGTASEQLVSTFDAVSYFTFNVLFPLVFLRAVDSLEKAGNFTLKWPEIVTITIILSALIPLILTPLELNYRDTTSMANIEYGRSYSVLGSIILLWPILVITISKWKLLPRIFSLSVISSIALISFSRGVAFTGLILILGTILLNSRFRSKILLGFMVSVSILFIIAIFFMGDWLYEMLWFWLLRFNIADNISAGLNFDLAESMESGRSEIWDMGIQLFLEHPFCGSGLGSTSPSIGRLTDNFYTYGGFHGLFLTVLVERGLFGLIGVFLIFSRIIWLITTNIKNRDSSVFLLFSFLCFIFFANSTGVEMFLYSSRAINVDITVYLFLFLAYLELGKKDDIRKTTFP